MLAGSAGGGPSAARDVGARAKPRFFPRNVPAGEESTRSERPSTFWEDVPEVGPDPEAATRSPPATPPTPAAAGEPPSRRPSDSARRGARTRRGVAGGAVADFRRVRARRSERQVERGPVLDAERRQRAAVEGNRAPSALRREEERRGARGAVDDKARLSERAGERSWSRRRGVSPRWSRRPAAGARARGASAGASGAPSAPATARGRGRSSRASRFAASRGHGAGGAAAAEGDASAKVLTSRSFSAKVTPRRRGAASGAGSSARLAAGSPDRV